MRHLDSTPPVHIGLFTPAGGFDGSSEIAVNTNHCNSEEFNKSAVTAVLFNYFFFSFLTSFVEIQIRNLSCC